MAVAVDFRIFQPADSRDDLLRKVKEAPAKHAEAILAAYEVLEKLHEKDVLSTLNGLLGAKDVVVDRVADLVSSAEMINLLRLGLMAGNLMKDINPDDLHGVLKEAKNEPPGFFQIMKRMTSKDARRALGAAGSVLNIFGAALGKKSSR
ncbi:DUF1641 domain-containing protein [Granulicella sibirica]|uniref:DUF1641 domain-containing protein n=1 Tax=Granulicella sibirica TaxID=2479048 RepID=A0A4Q0SW75_9BACT|nr:DUF1641 domain-containing protein [Granulicella sibirica]RXH54160.1 hypothetical protein GRAN_4811 [Granulicella sibirica]